MKLRLLVVVVAAAAGLAACSTGTNAVDQSNGSSNGYVQVSKRAKIFDAGQRKAAPAVVADLIGGGHFDLSAQRGQVVVMNLWGSWCPDCRVEARDLQSVYAAHKDSGVAFVGIDIRDDPDGAEAYQRNFGVAYPSINDPSGRVALAFRDVPPSAIPSTLVIDKDGRIAALNLGVITADELNQLIAAAQ